MTDQNSLTFLNTTLQAKICEILLRLVMFSKSNVFMVIIIDGRAQLTARTYEVNKVFRFFEGIWLYRKSRQNRNIFSEKVYFTLYVCYMF